MSRRTSTSAWPASTVGRQTHRRSSSRPRAAASTRSRSERSSVSPTGSQTRFSRRALGRAPASPSSFRSALEAAVAHTAVFKIGSVAVPLSVLFGHGGIATPAVRQRRGDRDHRPRRGWSASSRSRASSARRRSSPARRAPRRTSDSSELIADASSVLEAGADRRRCPGTDHLHVRDDRAPERGAARPSRPARPSARASSSRTTGSPGRATGSGRRRIGPGSAG